MKTKQILEIMKIVSWIIFIGLCIKAGALIISSFVSLFINQDAAKDLYLGLDLLEIYNYGKSYYISTLSFIITIGVLKAYLFYWVIKITSKISLEYPFSEAIANLITKISYISLSIGLVALLANNYSKWLLNKGIISFRLNWSSQEFIFMAGILFIIALIFKRGIELQNENDLTI